MGEMNALFLASDTTIATFAFRASCGGDLPAASAYTQVRRNAGLVKL